MSSEEEMSDDDELFIDYLDFDSRVRRVRNVRDRTNPFTFYDDEEFKMRFRLTKLSVENIMDLLRDELEFPSNRNMPVSPLNQLLLTLRFYATSSFQIVIGDLAGVHQCTVSRIINKVSGLICNERANFIRFPTTRGEKTSTMRDFHDIAAFPGVLGAIDCTHVAIRSPGGDTAEMFRNRKGYFSINVQAVCNARLEITNVVARWPGSAHDANIFNQSRICGQFETSQITGGYLVGDAGYPCKKFLLTPLSQVTSPGESRYNYCHIRTRNPIERAFGVIKKRFPCLQLGLRVKLDRTLKIIVACMILHNVAVRNGDREAPDDRSLTIGARIYENVLVQQANTGNTTVRTALIQNVFSR